MKKKFVFTALGLALMTLGYVQAESPAIGSKAPDFSLIDTQGKTHVLSDYKGRVVVLEWTNFGCPFVVKHYGSKNMQSLQKKYSDKGVIWLSICSSAKGKQGQMSPADWNKEIAHAGAHSLAYLLDEDGKVGSSYDAKTTPHMYIIDANGNLVYKGAIDDKPTHKQSDIKGAKNYVSAALDEILAGKKVTIATTEPYGCSVKYAK
ncbi:MAG: Thiol-disulfide oxidoreductase ResA [Elusimicrobia bacterium]|nr:Thiol-disulfide oxidoreductase ResA [Elusimicrobiota bacterium]